MAKDLFHDAVRRGLEKDQWTVTDDPFMRKFERSPFSPKILSFTSIAISQRLDTKSQSDTIRDSLRDGKAERISHKTTEKLIFIPRLTIM